VEKEQSREKLMAELKQKKREVKIWKYWARCYFRRLKKVAKKVRHIKKKKTEIVQREDNMPEHD